jgi:protein phosphatase
MAISAFFERYYTQLPASVPEMLGLALQDANQRVFNESERKPEWHGMGTTLSSVVVDGDNAYVSQVGDSRVYVKRVREKLVQVTNDHSLVAEQVRHGFLRPEEAQKHSMKNLITRAVGIKNSVKYDLFSFKLKAGDALLICSDGLSNLVSDDDIDAALGAEDVECAARTLLERALTEGGSDNITAIVVRITEAPPAKAIHAGASEVPLESGSFLGKLKQILQGN